MSDERSLCRRADDRMRAAMRQAKVGGFAVWAIHLAVWIFGRASERGLAQQRLLGHFYCAALALI